MGHHAGLSPLQVRQKAFVETVKQHRREVEYRGAEPGQSGRGARRRRASSLRRASGPRPRLRQRLHGHRGSAGTAGAGPVGAGRRSVTGFDNIELSEFTNPALTTVTFPSGHRADDAGSAAAGRGRDAPREIVLDAELVLRDSTGPHRENNTPESRLTSAGPRHIIGDRKRFHSNLHA